MSLVKRTYVDGETVITAENLNDIQDAIIENEEAIEDQGEAIEGKYTKPSGGIPSTDLASAVQTSLGKADTAYQKPSGGIPSTDLASAVQTSLGKADTALQSSDIDNTLTVSGKAADAKKTGDEISGVKNTLSLLDDEIPDTVQTITFDQNGNVQSITHSRNNVAVRTDVFTFAANSVTEVRTLSTGQSLTIVTNLSTLETTITYSEGGN